MEYLLVICLSTTDVKRARNNYIVQHEKDITSKPSNSRVIVGGVRIIDFISINSKKINNYQPRDISFTKAVLAQAEPTKIYDLIKYFRDIRKNKLEEKFIN